MTVSPYPFSAVVGHDDAKLALLLASIDPRIGGVLLRGQKGSAKTTLARGLAALRADQAPFAELPLGATEDRLVGTLDIGAALTGEGVVFESGVLASADGGVLYVDEVNLLADHLVDVLLDVAVSGVNRIEREGISHQHPARFVLIGSMNPEEGELRPQLLDRFGLAVDVMSSEEPTERSEAVRRRLTADQSPDLFLSEWAHHEAELTAQLASARPAGIPTGMLDEISALCVSVGAEGLRADITIARAAAALAGWESRPEATEADVRRVAPMALAHRRRRHPFEDPGLADDELEAALDEAFDAPPPPDPEPSEPGGGTADDRTADPDDDHTVIQLRADRSESGPSGRRSTAPSDERGRLVGDRRPVGTVRRVAVRATAREAASRRRADPEAPALLADDIREPVREQAVANLLVLAVDASGSMNAPDRMEAAKGAVLGLLLDAYQRRDRVAMVTFRDESAEVVLRPTSSVEIARIRLEQLASGGATPLGEGIRVATDLASVQAKSDETALLVIVTDGRATAAPDGIDPWEAALAEATVVAKRNIDAVVVDIETGANRLGLAAKLAERMGARHLPLPDLAAVPLESQLRTLLT